MRKMGILFCIALLMVSTGCTTDTNESETVDYRVAYEDYNDEVLELNNMEDFKTDEEHLQAKIYYKDVSGYIVPVVRGIPKQEGIAKTALTALIDTANNRIDLIDIGLSPILPEDITFELAMKENNIIRVDFNEAIMSFASQREEDIAVQSIVYTLTEFDSVDSVQIVVNNETVEKLTHGTNIGKPLNRNNINGLDNYIEGESIKRTFYTYNNITNKYTYYIPITKNIIKEDNNLDQLVQDTIEINKELKANLPEGFNVKESLLEDSIAYITIEQGMDNNDEKFIHLMKALCLTLWENEGVKSVKLIVENNEVENMQIKTFTIPQYANVY